MEYHINNQAADHIIDDWYSDDEAFLAEPVI